MSNDQTKCPVDHSTRSTWLSKLTGGAPKSDGAVGSAKAPVSPEKAPVSAAQTDSDGAKCPVPHDSRAQWVQNVSVTTNAPPQAIEAKSCASDELPAQPQYASNIDLPTERMISSIPRTEGQSNWIYPSEKQFFEAMQRKQWNPEAQDMKTVVPIHNAVNERAWQHILNWERATYQESVQKCGGIKLTSFQGNPAKLTPRAWFNSTFLGYEKPFDRHDWLVDRCGTQVEYVIDFYSGNGNGASFFLDVRPKLNNWEGIKLRAGRAFGLL